jgi:hypothetical protein
MQLDHSCMVACAPPKTISPWDGFWPAKEGEFYIKEFLIIDDWYDGRRYWTLEIGRATGRFASSF